MMAQDGRATNTVLQAALDTIGRAIAVIDRSVQGENVNADQLTTARHVIDHFTPLIAELRQLPERKDRGFNQ
jgi:hypothetical protein